MITEKDIVDACKSLFMRTMPNILLKGLQAYAPIFLTFPLNKIADMFITKLCTFTAEKGDIGTYRVHVNFEVNKEGSDFLKAKAKLRIAEESGDQIKIKEAQDEVKITMEKFVNLTH